MGKSQIQVIRTVHTNHYHHDISQVKWWNSLPLSLPLPALQWCSLQGQRPGGPHRRHRWVFGWSNCASTRRMGSQNPHWAAKESPLGWQKVELLPSTSIMYIHLSASLSVAQTEQYAYNSCNRLNLRQQNKVYWMKPRDYSLMQGGILLACQQASAKACGVEQPLKQHLQHHGDPIQYTQMNELIWPIFGSICAICLFFAGSQCSPWMNWDRWTVQLGEEEAWLRMRRCQCNMSSERSWHSLDGR